MAIKKLTELGDKNNIQYYNLGTGEGYSVLDVLKGFEKALGKPIKTEFIGRRFGDVPKLLANNEKALEKLGWKVTKNLDDMCADSVQFITKRIESKK